MRGLLFSVVVAVFLVGCNASKGPIAGGSPKPPAPPDPGVSAFLTTSGIVPYPGVDLGKASMATTDRPTNSTYELDMATDDPPEKVAEYYRQRLGQAPVKTDSGYRLEIKGIKIRIFVAETPPGGKLPLSAVRRHTEIEYVVDRATKV